MNAISEDLLGYYSRGKEQSRLSSSYNLERERTQELLIRYLPPTLATVLDIGGGAGVYALWLAKRGYAAHLIDPVPLHIEQAKAASSSQSAHPLASAVLGDARRGQEAERPFRHPAVFFHHPAVNGRGYRILHLPNDGCTVQSLTSTSLCFFSGSPAISADSQESARRRKKVEKKKEKAIFFPKSPEI